MSERLSEGRKSNILKILSQLHAYLKRYQDLDKTEIRFEQRLEDAGCIDMYAVIDDVLDIVETGKKADKARMLNKVYKKYFPKSADKDPASDEEVEAALGDETDVGDEEAGVTEEPTEGTDLSAEGDDLTLGDVRKEDQEYLSGSVESDEDEDYDGTVRDYDDIENDENRRMYSDEDDDEDHFEEARHKREALEDEDWDDDEEEGSVYSIDDLEPGMIVNCGVYGDNIIVSSIHDDHRFWGTDNKEDYLSNGENASGWYFDVSDVEDIIGSVHDTEDDMEPAMDMDKDDSFIEKSIKLAQLRAKALREGIEWPEDVRDDSADYNNDPDLDPEHDEPEDEEDYDPSADAEGVFDGPKDMISFADAGGSLNDEAFDFIEDLKSVDPEISDDELIDSIIKEFSGPGYPMEREMAVDILDEYKSQKDPANEEATEGDIETEYEDLLAEGYPDSEALDRLVRKYMLTRHEIEMILSGARGGSKSHENEGPEEVDEYPTIGEDEEDIGPFDEAAAKKPAAKTAAKPAAKKPVAKKPVAKAPVKPAPVKKAAKPAAPTDDVSDVSDFESPVGARKTYDNVPARKGPSRAAHPAAMDKVRTVWYGVLGKKKAPIFIDAGATGYRVKMGTWKEGPNEEYVKLTQRDADELQHKLDAAGFPEVKAKMVGVHKEWLAFIVPYGLNESVLTPNFAKIAKDAYSKLAQGANVNAVINNLRDSGLSAKEVDQVFQYLSYRAPLSEMVGPKDQGGTAAPTPAPQAPTPYDTTASDLQQKPAESTSGNPDQTQELLQNPEFKDFFDAMSKINPQDMQNLSQALTQEGKKRRPF